MRRDDFLLERERLAAEAFVRVRSGQHWRDWCLIAEGMAAGRERAMREAGTNDPVGRGYNAAFGRWMDKNGWPRKVDKATRNHLLWVADRFAQIEAWRETLASNKREALNHPTAVRRAFEAAHRVAADKAAETAKLSPVAKLKEALRVSEEERHVWERRAKDGGSLFNLRRDRAEDIVRIILDEASPTKATTIARGLLKGLKAKGHAG
jgi:hypothetical protein